MIAFSQADGFTFVDNERDVESLKRYWTLLPKVFDTSKIPDTVDGIREGFDSYVLISDAGMYSSGVPTGPGVIVVRKDFAGIIYSEALYDQIRGSVSNPVKSVKGVCVCIADDARDLTPEYLWGGRSLENLLPSKCYSTPFARAFDVIPTGGVVPVSGGVISSHAGRATPLGIDARYLTFKNGVLTGAFGVDHATIPLILTKPGLEGLDFPGALTLGTALAKQEPVIVADFADLKQKYPRAGYYSPKAGSAYQKMIEACRDFNGVTHDADADVMELPVDGADDGVCSLGLFAAVAANNATEKVRQDATGIMYLEDTFASILKVFGVSGLIKACDRNAKMASAFYLMAGDLNEILERYQEVHDLTVAQSFELLLQQMQTEAEHVRGIINEALIAALKSKAESVLRDKVTEMCSTSGVYGTPMIAMNLGAKDFEFDFPNWLKLPRGSQETAESVVNNFFGKYISARVEKLVEAEGYRPIVAERGGLPQLRPVFIDLNKNPITAGTTLMFPGLGTTVQIPVSVTDAARGKFPAAVKSGNTVLFEADTETVFKVSFAGTGVGESLQYSYARVQITQGNTTLTAIPLRGDDAIALVDSSFADEIANAMADIVLGYCKDTLSTAIQELSGFNADVGSDRAYWFSFKIPFTSRRVYVPSGQVTYKSGANTHFDLLGVTITPVTVDGESRVGLVFDGVTKGADQYNAEKKNRDKYRSDVRGAIQRTCPTLGTAGRTLSISSPSELGIAKFGRVAANILTGGLFYLGAIWVYHDCPTVGVSISYATPVKTKVASDSPLWGMKLIPDEKVPLIKSLVIRSIDSAAWAVAYVEVKPLMENFTPSAEYDLVTAIKSSQVFVPFDQVGLFTNVTYDNVDTLLNLLSAAKDPDNYLSVFRAQLTKLRDMNVKKIYYLTSNDMDLRLGKIAGVSGVDLAANIG